MNWLSLLIGSLLTFTIEDVKGCSLPTQTLTIQKIARKTGGKLDVCSEESLSMLPQIKFLLIITLNDGSLQLRNSGKNTIHCVEFDIDITEVTNEGETINIAIQILDTDDCPTKTGDVTVIYPKLPDASLKGYSSPDPVISGDGILLLQGNMNGFSLSDLGSLKHISSDDDLLNYYFGKLPAIFQLCKDLPDVNFCDEPLSIQENTFGKGPTVTSSMLSYGYPNDVLSTVTMESSSSGTSDILHILYMSDAPGEEVFCQPTSLSGSCDITWPIPTHATATFRLIGLLGDIPQESETHSIPDRELLTGEISPGIVEARWLMISDDTKSYHLILNTEPKIASDPELSVDCSQVTLAHCFGYFSDLTQDTYKITVQKKKSDSSNDVLMQIQSAPISTTSKVFKELHIQNVDVSEYPGHGTVLVEVCFNHTNYDIDKIFSHYEFVLINEKGQWLKHHLMIKDTDGDLCFSPYTINPMAFDISMGCTLVVTQRAENGFNVLASGKTHVSFSAV